MYEEKKFYVYIMASRPNGAIYIGVTSDLIKRVFEHKNKFVKGHTEKYDIDMLVYYEVHGNVESAILREKRLKQWNRAMKNDLITKKNPLWEDLYPMLSGGFAEKGIPAFAGMTMEREVSNG